MSEENFEECLEKNIPEEKVEIATESEITTEEAPKIIVY